MTKHAFGTGRSNCAYIGEGVTVKGAICVPGEIVVDGMVEGDVTAQSIRIGASGAIKGKVVSTDLEVSGTLGKSADVKEVLVIRSSGRVEGHFSCGDFEVEKGAVFAGGIFSVYAAPGVSPVNDNDHTAGAKRAPRVPTSPSLKLNAAE
jgi:cytoskeletal protein CcmA (bactofilin family)